MFRGELSGQRELCHMSRLQAFMGGCRAGMGLEGCGMGSHNEFVETAMTLGRAWKGKQPRDLHRQWNSTCEAGL
eukprot:1160617-Pelagomonas_calceolata.AAC.7